MSIFSKIGDWLQRAAGSVVRTVTGIPNLGAALGPALGAGAQYFLGQRQQDQQNESAQQQAARNEALQREFAQNSIRWRVEDARQAGLHPLFALGGSGAAFQSQPIHIGGGPDMAQVGQNLGRAASALMTRDESEARQTALLAARASIAKDEAIARYYDSEAARNRQQSSPAVPSAYTNEWGATVNPIAMPESIGVRSFTVTGNEAEDARWQAKRAAADAAVSHLSNRGAAQPAWQVYQLRPGVKGIFPAGSSFSEAVESVAESHAVLAWVISENIRQYGPGWVRTVGSHLPGVAGALMREVDSLVGNMGKASTEAITRAASAAWSRIKGNR